LKKTNSENWSFSNYLAATGVKTNEEFNQAKVDYLNEMNKMKSLEDFVDFKRQIGRYIKEAQVMFHEY
jgi:hypothetical protein